MFDYSEIQEVQASTFGEFEENLNEDYDIWRREEVHSNKEQAVYFIADRVEKNGEKGIDAVYLAADYSDGYIMVESHGTLDAAVDALDGGLDAQPREEGELTV